MTKQINVIQAQNESNTQVAEQNRFFACEQIVDELVEKGLPNSFNPDTFISKISKNYNISYQEARTCVKLALKQLEQNQETTNVSQGEKLNAQCGYFYPQGYSQPSVNAKQDGMDNLTAFSNYNRLMFGIR